ncbi:MAG: iron ABC transporter permease [Lachnospiraceae bacterium]|nr:iron ABC transporter permease [Lachnospiraceae bacterium]
MRSAEMSKKRTVLTFLTALMAVLVLSLLGLAMGSVGLSVDELLPAVREPGSIGAVILWKLRLPRVLGALLSGMALSTAGVLLQSVSDNELCAPNVIGVNAGAGLGVMVLLCFLPGAFYLLPVAAFAGALLTTILVLLVSETASSGSRQTSMILAGVAVSALLNAGISFLSQRYPDVLSSYVYFSTGNFNGVYMKDLWIPGPLILLGTVGAFFLTPGLNLLCLGEDQAASLGIPIRLIKNTSLILASCLCGASVSYAGMLGFVGLMVPHMSRRLVGTDLRVVLPFSAILGSALVILADLAGRVLFAPAEIAAGVFLSLLGAPFFLYLLLRRRRT